jgi:hypothetical protein
MIRLEIKGNWNQVKGRLKQQYAQTTPGDRAVVESDEDERPQPPAHHAEEIGHEIEES